MKNKRIGYIFCIVVDIFIVLLAGFVCWLTKSAWGILTLLFLFYEKDDKKEKDDEEKI